MASQIGTDRASSLAVRSGPSGRAILRGFVAAGGLFLASSSVVAGPSTAPASAGGANGQTTPVPVAAADLLPAGSAAPVFSARAVSGGAAAPTEVDLASLKGHFVVLYFYPKDDTPGCTKEACEFRDSWGALQKRGVLVYGVSTQDVVSHKAFAEKHHLPFPLIADEKGAIAALYKVPVLDGKARRITYLIGPDGRIRHVWPTVNPLGHAAEVMKIVEGK